MLKVLTAACVLGMLLTAVAAPAEARIYGNVYVGGGGYGGYGGGYYPGYYGYPYYVAPPPVVYAAPVYAQPAPVYEEGYAPAYPPQSPPPGPQPQATQAPAPMAASDANSPTFTDDQGRTCREYRKPAGAQPSYDTVCQQPDGSWRLTQ